MADYDYDYWRSRNYGRGGYPTNYPNRGSRYSQYNRSNFNPNYGNAPYQNYSSNADYEDARFAQGNFDNYPLYGSFEDFPYSSNFAPTTWTYEEYWLIPGPFTGVGPVGYTRSDADIEEDICSRLTANGQLDASGIDVSVNNHEVTLKGDVDTRRSKRLAEDIADSVIGVEDVHNNLHVKKQGRMQGQGQMTSGQMMGNRPSNLHEGEEVIGDMGYKIGTVKKINNNDFVLNRPAAQDLRVPFNAIKDTAGNQVKLDVSSDQIDKQGWQHA